MAFINGFQMHVSIPYFSGQPQDVVTNVWSAQFSTLAPTNTDWTNWRSRLITFYNVVYGGAGFTIAPWLRPALTTWKGYDMTDPKPRTPKFQSTTAITGSVSTPSTTIPEIAACVSFQGVPVSGLPQARRRGRIFLGGLGAPITGGTASTFPQLTGSTTGTIAAAAAAMKTGMATDGWTWSVYSRADDAFVTVANGWMDDAPDIQRRRETAKTIRTTF